MEKYDDDYVRTSHPSYAVASFSRVHCSGHGERLFMSPVPARTAIELTIQEAESVSDNMRDWAWPLRNRTEIIRLAFSPAQFSELLTTMNRGEGVPCTIVRRDGVGVAPCEQKNAQEHTRDQLKQTLKRTTQKLETLETTLKEQLEAAKISKKAQNAIMNAAEMISQEVQQNMPYWLQEFQEKVDQTVTNAKSQITDFLAHVEQSAGKNLASSSTPSMLALDEFSQKG